MQMVSAVRGGRRGESYRTKALERELSGWGRVHLPPFHIPLPPVVMAERLRHAQETLMAGNVSGIFHISIFAVDIFATSVFATQLIGCKAILL